MSSRFPTLQSIYFPSFGGSPPQPSHPFQGGRSHPIPPHLLLLRRRAVGHHVRHAMHEDLVELRGESEDITVALREGPGSGGGGGRSPITKPWFSVGYIFLDLFMNWGPISGLMLSSGNLT